MDFMNLLKSWSISFLIFAANSLPLNGFSDSILISELKNNNICRHLNNIKITFNLFY